MKKIIKLENLDCAHCAQKMQDAIKKIDGVTNIDINFMLQKMTLEADDHAFDAVITEVKKTCKRIEPDCILKI